MTLSEAVRARFEARKGDLEAAAGWTLALRSEGDRHEVRHDDGGDLVASFTLRESLQCNGIAVPLRVRTEPPFRRRGIGRILEVLRIEAAKAAGCGLMVATALEGNEAQSAIMRGAGWHPGPSFPNPRTGNRIVLWTLVLA